MALESIAGVLAGNPTGSGAQAVGRPATTSPDYEMLDVFAIGLGDNLLWHFFQLPNGVWTREPRPGSLPAGAVSAVRRGPGLLDVFALSGDKTLRHWSLSGAIWVDNVDRGGSMAPGGPCAAVSPSGGVDIFALDEGGFLRHWTWNGTTFSASVPVPSSNLLAGVPAATWTTTKLHVFAVDGTRKLMYYSPVASGIWAARPLGGNMATSGLAAVSLGARLDVFGVDQGDQELHVWSSVDEGGTWTESTLGGYIDFGLPGAVCSPSGRIDVFAVGHDGALWHWRCESGTWGGPTSLGGHLPAEGVAAVARTGERVDAFAVGPDATLQHWPDPKEGRLENWANWAGNISVQPLAIFHPSTVEEIVAIVKAAEAKGLHVRASGSHWSFSDVAVTDDFVIETRQLNRRIDVVLNNALDATGLAMRNLKANTELYHVEAGITVHDLGLRLDQNIDNNGLPAPLALTTQGNSGGQTLAGVVSTAVHGGDFDLPPICEAVQAIHLVGPRGIQYWIERGTKGRSITDPVKLRTVLDPGIVVMHNDAAFNAVLVSMGSMGVIYSLVIRVRAQFALSNNTRKDVWSMVKSMLLGPGGARGSIFTTQLDPFMAMITPRGPLPPPRYLEIVVNPANADPTCWITTRTEMPLVPFEHTTGPLYLYALEALPPSALAAIVNELLGGVAGAAVPALVALLPLLAPVAAAYVIAGGNVGQLITGIANFATTHGAPELIGILEDVLLDYGRKPGSTQGKGFEIMDTYDGDDSFNAYRSMSMEVTLDGSSAGFIGYVDECIAIVRTAMEVGGVPFGGYISLRFCAPSEAFLAFEQYPLNCIVEIACFKGMIGNLEVINRMEEAMYRYKGVPHWGQYHRMTEADGYVSKRYPKLKDWRHVQQTMSAGKRTFENAFTWRCGLST
jgi:FAD binding domain/D-arabinono-1,4-lactone oxidase